MSGEAQTLYDVYQSIEELGNTYAARQLKKLIRGTDLTTEEVHVLRGKAQATEDLLTQLRNTLGYSPDSL